MNVLKSWTVGEFLGFPRTSGIACQLQGQLSTPRPPPWDSPKLIQLDSDPEFIHLLNSLNEWVVCSLLLSVRLTGSPMEESEAEDFVLTFHFPKAPQLTTRDNSIRSLGVLILLIHFFENTFLSHTQKNVGTNILVYDNLQYLTVTGNACCFHKFHIVNIIALNNSI